MLSTSLNYRAKILKRFEDAVREHAWKGSKSPEEHEEIEKEYKEAKRLLKAILMSQK